MTEPPSRPPANPALDALLAELSAILAPAEDALVGTEGDTRHPLVLVLGAPRSGTTLLTQWLAASGRFAVPTNLLSRFSRTPAIGARIQLLLTDPRYSFRDELFELKGPAAAGGWSSDLGKTRGALAPAEFAFFWRRFLGTREIEPLGAERMARVDAPRLRASLAALEAAFGKPLAMKGMFLQYDLETFAKLLPRAFFLHVRREPVANTLAILEARERYHGDRAVWYSARPAEYARLAALDPVRQAAGQVLFTERAIARGLAALPPERSLSLGYEDFCAAPSAAWTSLREKLGKLGCDVGPSPEGPASFAATSRARSGSAEAPAAASALAELAAWA
jgi:hypothetical protein